MRAQSDDEKYAVMSDVQTATCIHFKILEGFWVCGRVCGDRSVFVTSHRPAHIPRAHASSLIKLCISHLKFFLFAWLCVSSFGYAVPRVYSGYALTGYCL